MKRSANYVTTFNSELLKPREHKLKNNTDTSEYAEVTPLYEKKLYDTCRLEQYSFGNNKKLHCLWQEKMNSIVKREVKVKRLRQLPDFIRDHHFHNQTSKFMPSQSLRNRPPAHFVLKPGPGIDEFGDKLIPDDMMMNRYQRDNNLDKSKEVLVHNKRLPKKGVNERLK